jgi:3-hydroxybutyryl-CoA dehydrogenase
VYDPADDAETAVRAYIAQAWESMSELGLTARGDPDRITFHPTAARAVEGAGFVQENVPERLPIKHATFAEIEPALATGALVASSASGLTLGQMQGGWRDPSLFILGHPFNPPHLIPLVEVMGNNRTAPGIVEAAEAFYADIGKITIRVMKEVPGHVANRLQAAVWREAIHLVLSGVASVGDVDKAMSAGPGLRDVMIPQRSERCLSPLIRRRQLFPSRSFSTTLPSIVSANRRLSLAFSSSSAFSLAASDTSMPPYLDLNL